MDGGGVFFLFFTSNQSENYNSHSWHKKFSTSIQQVVSVTLADKTPSVWPSEEDGSLRGGIDTSEKKYYVWD